MTEQNEGRSVQIIVYDVHGGPFPKKALDQIEQVLEKVMDSFPSLVMTVVKEQ